jgi:hypothetical protein
VSLRARPLGATSPWYLGGGFTTIDVRAASGGDPLTRSGDTREHTVLLTGIGIPLRWARPLIEVQVLDPAHPDQAQVHLYTGLAVRLR